MPVGWVTAAAAVYSAASSSSAQSSANNNAADANGISQANLDFQKQQYNDSLPYINAARNQSLTSANLQNQAAQQQLDRSQTAWNQNQQATSGATGQMGLNALGGQWLTPEQQQELLGLQQTLGQNPYSTTKTATTNPGLTTDQQSRLDALTQKQQTLSTSAPSYTWDIRNVGTGDGQGSEWYQKMVPGVTTGGLSDAEKSELQQLQATKAAAGQQSGTQETQQTNQALLDQQAAARARIAELQNIANQNIQAAEVAKGQKVKDTAADFANQQIGLGETNAQSILNDSNTVQGDINGKYGALVQQIKDTAKQRADANEAKQKTATNAAISNAADQANRQMLRVGGDPNKMAALGLETAQSQQLARIGSGNQIAATNIANLNAADDQARGLDLQGFNQAESVKSSALDAARESRNQAKQTALGMNYSASQQSDAYANNAKDKANQEQNNLLTGTANFGQGFANTSSSNASGASAAASGATQSANNGANAGLQNASLVNSASNSTANNLLNSAYRNNNQYAGAISSGLGSAAAGLYDAYKNWNSTSGSPSTSYAPSSATMQGLYGTNSSGYDNYSGEYLSDETAKEDIQDLDDEDVLAGLSSVYPKKYKYKRGRGDGKHHIGPMAQDMHKEFGDTVAPGGTRLSVQDQLGLHHAAIGALARKMDSMNLEA